MTISEELYVWTWLPGQTEPVLAGKVDQAGPLVTFIYALRYRSRPDAISLFTPELPLRPGVQEPADGLTIAGVLRDGSPDRWGRGVIERRRGVAPNSPSALSDSKGGEWLAKFASSGDSTGMALADDVTWSQV